MDQFAHQVETWQPFYATVAAASATLVGLLFVSLSINLERFRKLQDTRMLRRSRQAFSSFIYILAIALMFLIPEQSPTGLGLPIICMAVMGFLRLSYGFFQDTRSWTANRKLRYLYTEFIFLLIAYSGMILISITILLGSTAKLNWMVGVVISLLVSASQNAWYLLFQVDDQPA